MSLALKKDAPQSGYKQTELGLIPDDWEIIPMEKLVAKNGLVRGPFGGALKKNIFVSKGYKVYEQRNAIYENCEIGEYYVDEQKYKELYRFAVAPRDLIISCSGTIGCIFQIPENASAGIINQALLKITLNNNLILSDYFQVIFKSLDFQELIKDSSQGGAMQNLVGMSVFRQTPVKVPKVEEQKAIAEALGDADEYIAALEKLIAKKRNIKQGAMQDLLTGKKRLAGFEGEWKEHSIEEIADKNIQWSFTGGPFGSNLKSSDYVSEGVRVIQLQNIGDGIFLNEEFVFTSYAKANELLSCNIYPDDIILSKMGDPVARACIIPNLHNRYLMCSDGIRLAVDKKKFDNHFIFYSINFETFRKSADNAGTGSTRKRIGLSELRKLTINCPTLPEQQFIAKIIFDMDSEISTLETKLEKAKQIKQGMMQDLLSGKVRLI